MIVKQTLRTERLLLRPFGPNDIDDALAYRDDADFVRFLPHIPHPFLRSDAERFVEVNRSEPWDRSPTFAVVLADRVIGTVNLDVESRTRRAMLGYAIGRLWWGQGIATEASRSVVRWGIATFALEGIWAATDIRNVRSQHVLDKLGMRRTGQCPSREPGRNGELIEEALYELNLRKGGEIPHSSPQ